MNFLDPREPVSLGATSPVCFWRCLEQSSSGTGAGRLQEAAEHTRLWTVAGLLLSRQHSVSRRPTARSRNYHVRPIRRRRDLCPDRGHLHPDCRMSFARAVAAMDAGDRLGRGALGHGRDRQWTPLSPALATGLYLGLGWGVVACYYEFAQVVSHRALVPIVLGGILYSVGAVLNLLHWPALFPGTFGTHELFHLFVLAGSLAHYLFILKVVVPFACAP